MKKKNIKGFTMVELIASVAIMGILLLVVIPNVFSVTERNKKTTYVNDARKFITAARSKFEEDASIAEPSSTQCLVFKLKDLRNLGLEKGPNNGQYNPSYSYVTITYNNGKYYYGVQLLEEYKVNGKNNYRGIIYTMQDDLEKKSVSNVVSTVEDFIDLNTLAAGVSRNCTDILYATGSNLEDYSPDNIKPGDILSVSFEAGANVTMQKTTTSCTVKENEKGCTVKVPPVTPKEGFSSVGYSTVKGARRGEKETIYLNRFSSKYYANAIDDQPPVIEFSQEEDNNYKETRTITVKVKDLGSGIAEGASFRYGWSTSNNALPTEYKEIKPTYEAEDKNKEISFEIEGKDLNGDYYLLVMPKNLKDTNNNQTSPRYSKGVFKFSNMKPICNITQESDIKVSQTTTLLLSCTDNTSKLIPTSKENLQSKLSITNPNVGKIVSVSDPTITGNRMEYQIVIQGIKVGGFQLKMATDAIKNTIGRGNDELGSKELVVQKLTNNISYEIDGTIESIEKDSDSCSVTSGTSPKCKVTLPYIDAIEGYRVVGLYNGNQKIADNTQYEIEGDTVLTVKTEIIRSHLAYDYLTNGGENATKTIDYNIPYNNLVTLNASAKKTGYDFIGWNTDRDATTALDPYNFHMPARNTTVYAIFRKQKNITVNYYDATTATKKSTSVQCFLYNNESDWTYSLPDEITGETTSDNENQDTSSIELKNTGPNDSSYIGLSPFPSSKLPEDPCASAQSTYYAIYKKSNEVTFEYDNTKGQIRGFNNASLTGLSNTINSTITGMAQEDDGEDTEGVELSRTCNDYFLYENDYKSEYSEGKCKISLPSISENEGYTYRGWTDAENGGTLFYGTYIVERDITLYGKIVDVVPPTWTTTNISLEQVKNENNTTTQEVVIQLEGKDTTGIVERNFGCNNTEEVCKKLDAENLANSIRVLVNGEQVPVTKKEVTNTSTWGETTVGTDGGTDEGTGTTETKKILHKLTYELRLTGIDTNKKGILSIELAAGTLKDGADNRNVTTQIQTGVEISDTTKLVTCKRATTLHIPPGKYVAPFGNLGNMGSNINLGDAFDCDVNADGIFDSDTERFYYISSTYPELEESTEQNPKYDTTRPHAVLIYYSNVKEGEPDNSYQDWYIDFPNVSSAYYNGPLTARKQLPTLGQWSNISLANPIRKLNGADFSYNQYAARILSKKDLYGCFADSGQKNIAIDTNNPGKCNYLFEGNVEYWIEELEGTGRFGGNRNIIRAKFENGSLSGGEIYSPGSPDMVKVKSGVRPVIEVPLDKIAY